MSATIMMPAAFDDAIRAMCSEAVTQAVTALAAKHGFDVEEALRDINVGDLKLVRKRGPSPKTEKVKSVAKKSKKSDNTDGKVKTKRAKTGYLMFQADARSATKDELTADLGEGEKLKPQSVVIAIAAKWKAISEDERAIWNAKAKAAASPDVSDDEVTSEVSDTETEPVVVVLGEELDEILSDEE